MNLFCFSVSILTLPLSQSPTDRYTHEHERFFVVLLHFDDLVVRRIRFKDAILINQVNLSCFITHCLCLHFLMKFEQFVASLNKIVRGGRMANKSYLIKPRCWFFTFLYFVLTERSEKNEDNKFFFIQNQFNKFKFPICIT